MLNRYRQLVSAPGSGRGVANSIARGGGIPLYPAIWGKPGTSITYKRRAKAHKDKEDSCQL